MAPRPSRINLATGTSQSLTWANSDTSQGRSLSADIYGNVVTGFTSGGSVAYQVSQDVGSTFGSSTTVDTASQSCAAINSTNGDLMFGYQKNGIIYLAVYGGELAGYQLLLASTNETFATQTVGTSSSAKAVVVTNQGGSSVAINGVSATGDFSQTNNGPATLSPGSTFTINIVFTPTATGTRTGQIDIAFGGTKHRYISLSGTGTATAGAGTPSTPASDVTFSSPTQTSLTVGWTNGNGTSRAAFMTAASAGAASPSDFIGYTANAAFGSGSQAGTGWYCVYNGTGSQVTVTGLTSSTQYRVHVVEYNGSAGAQAYNTTTSGTNPANGSTSAPGYTVTFQTDGTAGATLTGSTSQTVASGHDTTAVTANAPTGAFFVNWTGTGGFTTTTSNPLTVLNVTAAMTITAHFAFPVCGNGVIELGEQCDDGNATPADGCSATCQLEPGWTCAAAGSACTTVCGDGILTANEQCDDGNTASGDGCSATCTLESGFACFFATPNLVQNGSFDSGNTGWTSQYTWANPSGVNAIWNAGTWSVSGDPHDHMHSAIAAGFKDAEGSASNMAAYFNGAATALDALDQSVSLTAGKSYVLSMYVTNWGGAGDSPYPQLSISIGGQVLTTNVTLSSSTWQRVGGTFTAASTGSAALKVVDSITASGGNDFAVDAVILREATAQACGRTCSKDADCAAAGTGFWCDTTAVGHPAFCSAPIASGDPIPTVPNRNPTDPPLGGTCTALAGAAVCASGACNTVENTCASATGGACTSNAQCTSDVCNSDGTCGCSASLGCDSSSYCDLSSNTCAPLVATTVSISASTNPAVWGLPVHFTATVSPSDATGSVQFTLDGVAFDLPEALSSGVAVSPDISSLAVGSHSVGVTYAGDTSHLGSSASLAGGLIVNLASTTTVLTASPNPSAFGQSVHLAAQVTSSSVEPTGTLTFKLGSTSLGTATLDGSGAASLDLASFPAGTDALTAVYAGDTGHASSTSSTVNQVVSPAATTTTLSLSASSSLHGQAITLTAQVASVAPGSGTPVGTITFMDGTNPLGTASLSGGGATLQVSTLAVGYRPLTAVYSGSDNFAASASEAAGETVHPSCIVASTVYAAQTPNPANPCRFCDPSTNTTDWTLRASGFACTADAYSCTSDVCDGAGTCTHPVVQGCLISGACIAESAASPSAECMQCNPALSTTAYTAKAKGVACTDDGSSITDDYCDGAGLCTHPLKNQCTIGGITYAGGSANPANSCQSCAPLTDNTHWTNDVQGFPCADDGLSCTWDTCDGSGTCGHRLYTGCLIDSACVAAGTTNASNGCQECNPALAADAYSPKAHGVACADDGLDNTLDICDGSGTCTHPLKGQCTIDSTTYDEGTVNPANPCQSCAPSSTATAWTNRASGYPCTSDGLDCTSDTCDGTGTCQHTLFTGCLISSACVGAGAQDPSDECRACNPAASTADYVAKAQGVACSDDGQPNTLDICDGAGTCAHPLKGQCTIDGTSYDANSVNPANPCQDCEPSASVSTWTNRVDGFPCTSDGLACTNDVCNGAGACEHRLFAGCLISGTCIGEGSLDPSNDCRACGSSASTSAYVNRSAGASCADDSKTTTLDVCDGSGACTHPLKGQCNIGSVVYDAGAANPQNPCQSCDPATSVSAWTNRPSQFPCTTDGLACTDDICDGSGTCTHPLVSGCIIAGACVAEGVADPANPCNACEPTASTAAYSPKPRGLACPDDGKSNTLDICDGSGACIHPLNGQCTVAGKVYDSGSANPGNPCQSCDSTVSSVAWSNRAADFPCTSDGLACTHDVCDGAGLCTHALASGCLIDGACIASGALDPASDCRACDPARSTSAYVVRQDTSACAGACTADSDCVAGTYCAADQVCRPQLADQTACTADDQCASGHCQSGACVKYALSGGCGCSSGAGSETAALLGAALALGLAARRRRARAAAATRG